VGSAHLDGEILYNGDSTDCGKYLIGKVASYVDEKDQHAATLTVDETLDFAWMMTTCGHHSYSVAKDEKSAEILDRDDKTKSKVRASQPCLRLQLHVFITFAVTVPVAAVEEHHQNPGPERMLQHTGRRRVHPRSERWAEAARDTGRNAYPTAQNQVHGRHLQRPGRRHHVRHHAGAAVRDAQRAHDHRRVAATGNVALLPPVYVHRDVLTVCNPACSSLPRQCSTRLTISSSCRRDRSFTTVRMAIVTR
jgi:hypothetical protein